MSGPLPLGDTALAATQSADLVVRGASVTGLGPAELRFSGGRVTEIGPTVSAGGASVVELPGQWIAPAFIDSHVHLAYLPAVAEMAAGGVAGVVDLAAPLSWLASDHGVLAVRASGPMVTAVGGYPTTSWGRDGYGFEVGDPASARLAVQQILAAGARVIKVPVTSRAALDDATLAAVVEEAHAAGAKVAAHALYDDEAARAAAAGADVLAHTPVEALSPATVAAWSGRAVVSTLGAFGGSATAVANLRALRAAGATVLYGTDFGNTSRAGIDAAEVSLLREAGMDAGAVLVAATARPAAYWGFEGLGTLAVGNDASFVVLPRDPAVDSTAWGEVLESWIGGVRR